MSTRRPAALLVVAVVLLTGCTGTGLFQDEGSPTPENFPGHIQVTLVTNGEMTNNDSGFYLDGGVNIHVEGETSTFEDLYLCLYDSDTELVEAHRIGTMEGNSYRNVTVETDQNVRYVVVDHPKFWQYDGSDAVRLVYDHQSEQYKPVGYQDVSLEYDREDMVGGCAEVS